MRLGAKEVDPFTFEIIRHKLDRVSEEACITLELVSGTTVTAEGHDYMVSLYTSEGELLISGVGFLHHLTSAAHAVRHILDNFSDDPGVFEDDAYLFNDPFTGALHTSDTYIIMPCHLRGKCVGFVADFVHVADIGAMQPAGWCMDATESYQEGFATKGLKLIERGKLRKDVWETILNLVRDPGMVALDLKSQMAACYVAKDRLIKIYDAYGFETVDAVCRGMIDRSEQLFRQRLLEFPDGIYRARQYFDYHGKLGDIACPVELAMIKEKDTLSYDFTGSGEQLPISVNNSYWSTWGGIFAPLFPLLCWDMPWNEGITKAVSIIAPEGTVVNAQRPAPVSIATVGILNIVNNLSHNAISKMLGASEKYKNRTSAIWLGAHPASALHGVDQRGDYFAQTSSEGFGGSGGAQAFKDGLDNGGEIPALTTRIANVENTESYFPIRYLFRRPVPDSGGPGKYRGGVCHQYAIVPHDSPRNSFSASLFPSRGRSFPAGCGIFGGYPGCNLDYIEVRESNSSEFPPNLASFKGRQEDDISFGTVDITGDDILYIHGCGGGGYGDPLDREPELVLKDVLQGLVTNEPARDIYGVVIDLENERVDVEATNKQRLALRKDRLGGREPEVDTSKRASIPPTEMRLGEYLQVAKWGEKAFIQCTWCGRKLCPADSNWKDNVVARKVSITKSGPWRRESGQFFMREFFCPTCATSLDVDVVYNDDPPVYDKVYRWPK